MHWAGADPELILGCCKVLQKYIKEKCVLSKRFAVDYFEQRAIFRILLSFVLYSLLHDIIKTLIKSFTGIAFLQYTSYFLW